MADLNGRMFERRGNHLVPSDLAAEEMVQALPEGKAVLMDMRRARSPPSTSPAATAATPTSTPAPPARATSCNSRAKYSPQNADPGDGAFCGGKEGGRRPGDTNSDVGHCTAQAQQ